MPDDRLWMGVIAAIGADDVSEDDRAGGGEPRVRLLLAPAPPATSWRSRSSWRNDESQPTRHTIRGTCRDDCSTNGHILDHQQEALARQRRQLRLAQYLAVIERRPSAPLDFPPIVARSIAQMRSALNICVVPGAPSRLALPLPANCPPRPAPTTVSPRPSPPCSPDDRRPPAAWGLSVDCPETIPDRPHRPSPDCLPHAPGTVQDHLTAWAVVDGWVGFEIVPTNRRASPPRLSGPCSPHDHDHRRLGLSETGWGWVWGCPVDEMFIVGTVLEDRHRSEVSGVIERAVPVMIIPSVIPANAAATA